MASSPVEYSSPTRSKPTDDPSCRNSQTNPDTIKRNRSVQFSAPPSPRSSPKVSRTRDMEDDVSPHHLAESSADEITPIVGRERGGSRHYDATAKLSGNGLRGESLVGTARSRKSSRTSLAEQQGLGGQDERTGWWRDLVEKYGSVELDNKGSVARDHLALGIQYPLQNPPRSPYSQQQHPPANSIPSSKTERTFLAWLRTSLAFASIGIAITQLFRLNTTISEREGLKPTNPTDSFRLRQVGKPLGATFLGVAILVLLIGGRRYFESQVCNPFRFGPWAWREGLLIGIVMCVVLDYTWEIPCEQREHLPYHFCGGRIDHHEFSRRLRDLSQCV